MKQTYHLRAITPIFSYGSDQEKPEIRPASIRGQLRWWMTILGQNATIPQIFGDTAGDKGVASKMIVRVDNIQGNDQAQSRSLPHKRWSLRPCYNPGTTFDLILQSRRESLDENLTHILDRTIRAWLSMGSLGLRSTRGGGCLEDVSTPFTEQTWVNEVTELCQNTALHVRLGEKIPGNSESAAREIICDTLAENAFRPHRALGGIQPRKTSPLRLRVVRFEENIHIAAIWIEENRRPLDQAIRTLINANKTLGSYLANAQTIVP